MEQALNLSGNFSTRKHVTGETKSCPFLGYHSTANVANFTEVLLGLIVFDAIFAVVGSISNAVVLLAIWRNPRLHSPSTALLFCLACTDLLNGVVTTPLAIAYQLAEMMGKLDISCAFGKAMESSAWLLTTLSAHILTAISVDRLIALTLHLRYTAFVTTARVLSIVMAISACYLSLVVARLLGVTQKTFYLINTPLIFVCISTNVIVYMKILKIVRYHQRAVISQQQPAENGAPGHSNNFTKIKKSAINFFYILGFFVIAYSPFMCVLFVYLLKGFSPSVKLAYYLTATITFVNSCLNPSLYCWRMRDIREAVIKTVRRS